jgi:hypothetical protein
MGMAIFFSISLMEGLRLSQAITYLTLRVLPEYWHGHLLLHLLVGGVLESQAIDDLTLHKMPYLSIGMAIFFSISLMEGLRLSQAICTLTSCFMRITPASLYCFTSRRYSGIFLQRICHDKEYV